MRRLALLALATGALLAAAPTPAQADFFKDLGDALSDLGDAIEDAARDDNAPKDGEADAPKPGENNGQSSSNSITWNPPPPTTGFSGATVYTPPTAARPRTTPQRRRNAQQDNLTSPASASAAALSIGARPGSMVDDAPPPRRAPRRDPVETAVIAPLPGFTQAPPRPAATYSPVLAAATLAPAAVRAAAPPPARLPSAKPAAVQNRSFVVDFNNRRIRVNDSLLQTREAALAPASTRPLVEAITAQLRRDETQRVKLHSEAVAQDDRFSEARRRSFDRARLIKAWLEAAGVRSTQIDMEVSGAGDADQVTLVVYKNGQP